MHNSPSSEPAAILKETKKIGTFFRFLPLFSSPCILPIKEFSIQCCRELHFLYLRFCSVTCFRIPNTVVCHCYFVHYPYLNRVCLATLTNYSCRVTFNLNIQRIIFCLKKQLQVFQTVTCLACFKFIN